MVSLKKISRHRCPAHYVMWDPFGRLAIRVDLGCRTFNRPQGMERARYALLGPTNQNLRNCRVSLDYLTAAPTPHVDLTLTVTYVLGFPAPHCGWSSSTVAPIHPSRG